MDFIKDSYWVFTTHSLYEILITDEDRDVWKIYLKQKMFDAALSFTKVIIIYINKRVILFNVYIYIFKILDIN